MAKLLCASVFIAFFYICISLAELCSGAPNNTNSCLPGDKDVVVTIVNRRDEAGKFHSQIKFEETGKEYPFKKSELQFNIDHDSTCRSVKCELPGPFYDLVPGFGYYKLHTNPKVWQSAKKVCEEEGTHLAVINSIKEMEILQEFRRRLPNMLNNDNDYLIYLGFNDIQTEGVWKTIFDEPLSQSGYVDWERGEPQNGDNENCGCTVTKTGKLHDCLCSDVLPFFCEREL